MAPRKAKKPEVEVEGVSPEAPVEKKKRGKRAADDASPKKASPAKRGRGKRAAEPEEVAEAPKRGRGKKAAPPPAPEDVSPAKKARNDEEATEDAVSPAKSPKKTVAKAKATKGRKGKKSPKSPVANGAGSKGKKAAGRAKRAAPAEETPDSTSSPPKARKGRQPAKKTDAKSPAKTPVKRGRKGKATTETTGEENGVKEVAKKGGKPRANATSTDWTKVDFSHEGAFKLKIASWNVSGMRAWITKGGLEYVEHERPDIFCLQEIKCKGDDIPHEARIKGYHPYWLCHSGYAGVAIYSKAMPMNVTYGLGDAELDEEGRVCTAEFEKFYLVCVYVPNAGRGLVTLPKRLRFDEKFQAFVSKLDQNKPVIICGDMNVAHQEIDLANPKTNKKNAGFTQEERDSLTKLFCLGFVDTFRHLYPKLAKAYTFWTYMMNARSKNVGWRLDYFIVSERLATSVVDSIIRSPVMGSDHCPIVGLFNF